MAGADPHPGGPAPKTFARWLTSGLAANGVASDLPFDVAIAAAEHLVKTGRMVPVDQWVEHMIAAKLNDENEGLF